MDIALGGQAHHIAPIADKYLYGNYSFCLNLGEVASISYTNP